LRELCPMGNACLSRFAPSLSWSLVWHHLLSDADTEPMRPRVALAAHNSSCPCGVAPPGGHPRGAVLIVCNASPLRPVGMPLSVPALRLPRSLRRMARSATALVEYVPARWRKVLQPVCDGGHMTNGNEGHGDKEISGYYHWVIWLMAKIDTGGELSGMARIL
jgi:hypothetical protein